MEMDWQEKIRQIKDSLSQGVVVLDSSGRVNTVLTRPESIPKGVTQSEIEGLVASEKNMIFIGANRLASV